MVETTDYYCPNECEWEPGVGVLLVVRRDKFGYVDGYQCQECGGTFREWDLDDAKTVEGAGDE